MSRICELREKAGEDRKRILLPEGNDERILKAASFISGEGIADICVLGRQEDISELAAKNDISMDGVEMIDPHTHDKKQEMIEAYYAARKHKGMTIDESRDVLEKNPLVYGAIMTRQGLVDGFVAGAAHTTSKVARAAIQCLRLDKEIGTVSSSFIMELESCPFGESGLFIFGDCGIIPDPSARQLAGIAIASSDIFFSLFEEEPYVALLSYSSQGSATGESIDKVRDALAKVRQKRPGMIIDGELQLDAAVVPEVAEKKCPDSVIAGKANVLIFPNLDAGNIAYKLTQRLGKARAVGPLLQGLEKPCSDLSRGCSWQDVVDAVAATAVRAQKILERHDTNADISH